MKDRNQNLNLFISIKTKTDVSLLEDLRERACEPAANMKSNELKDTQRNAWILLCSIKYTNAQ